MTTKNNTLVGSVTAKVYYLLNLQKILLSCISGRWNLKRQRRSRKKEFERKDAPDARNYINGKRNLRKMITTIKVGHAIRYDMIGLNQLINPTTHFFTTSQ